jgi:hypothetical protein
MDCAKRRIITKILADQFCNPPQFLKNRHNFPAPSPLHISRISGQPLFGYGIPFRPSIKIECISMQTKCLTAIHVSATDNHHQEAISFRTFSPSGTFVAISSGAIKNRRI